MIIYYTDGSASPNPGPGGFSVIKNGKPYIVGGEDASETTNIRMEGLAIVAALEDSAGEACQIYTDSEFWINVITKWAPGWAANGWKKKGGEIKNLDIVQKVYPLYESSDATLTWVRGHEGDEGNEMADEWANIARERGTKAPQKVEQESAEELDPAEIARQHFAAGKVMQLSTLHEGSPRVNSVYYVASDDNSAVYWMSEPERRHSYAIATDSSAAGAVVVKSDYPVIGLQFTGHASAVSDIEEVKHIATKYGQKYGGLGGDLHERISAGVNKHVLYKMTIDSLEMFDEVNFPGGKVISVDLY
jgi:ribonuclease HI